MSVTGGATGRNVDWGLYRYFLAVANTGSLTAAAKHLGVSQPTVGRQIQALEEGIGARLFDRANHGYVVTSAGEAIVELAKVIEDRALDIERRIAGEDGRPKGRVRVSAAEGLATYWLAPVAPKITAENPDIEVELIVGSAALDLMRREADVVLRIGEPGCDELVGLRVGQVHFGLFASDCYAARHGLPKRLEDMADHALIESTGTIANLAQVKRLRELAGGSKTSVSCNNLVTQFQAVQAGAGIMALPLYMAQSGTGLRRLFRDEFDLSLDLWLLVHRDLRPVARIGVVFEYLADALRRDRELFTGSAPIPDPNRL